MVNMPIPQSIQASWTEIINKNDAATHISDCG
jgi:hypothetical protein